MTGQASVSIDSYLTHRGQARTWLRRVETPVETPAVGGALEAQAAEPFSEEKFIRLAEQEPMQLVELLRSGAIARPALLTFAAEAAGRMSDSRLVINSLVPLLQHADAAVREGAVYGLSAHLEGSLEARDALRRMVAVDPSPGVRAAIEDALALLD